MLLVPRLFYLLIGVDSIRLANSGLAALHLSFVIGHFSFAFENGLYLGPKILVVSNLPQLKHANQQRNDK